MEKRTCEDVANNIEYGEKLFSENKTYLSIYKCSKHNKYCVIISSDEDEGGTRITTPKCCGSWDTEILKSELKDYDIRDILGFISKEEYTMWKHFRKKPIVVNAVRVTNDNKNQVFSFLNTIRMNIEPSFDTAENLTLIIPTLEGDMVVCIGDWIIQGVNGELYPCKDDIFKKTYDEE